MIRYKMLQLVALSIVTLMAAAGSGVAAPVVMSLQPTDYASFGVTGQATDLLSEAYNHRNIFRGIVNSQVFTLDGGGYLYLYQTVNQGPSVLEVMGISPFADVTMSGYLVANDPAGFLSGGLVPLGATDDPAIPNISYNYPASLGAHVPAGSHTVTLYLVSPNAPIMGEAYVINSGVSVVPTYVAIPEPATMALLGGGLSVLIVGRRRHNRRIG